MGGVAVCWGAILAEAAVCACWLFTDMAWLWWNVVGCVVGVIASLVIQAVLPERSAAVPAAGQAASRRL